jgi:hypothetical protein
MSASVPPTPAPAPATPTPSPSLDTSKLERLLAAQSEALLRLNQRFDESEKRNAQAPKAPLAPGQAYKEFADNPEEKIRNVMREMISPLNDEVNYLKAERMYNSMKAGYKTNPKIAKVWQYIEPEVDRVIMGGAPGSVNPQAVEAAVVWAMGQVALGNINVPTDAPPPNPGNNGGGAMDPPHMRPSTPNRPNLELENKPKLRELSENEEVLRRRSGMSKEQWITASELRPDEVINHVFRPTPPKPQGT